MSLQSKNRRIKRNNTNHVVNPDPKTERTRQKTRPDMKRIFLRHFQGEIAKKCTKNIGKSPPKTQGHKKRAKTKIRSRKLIAQTDPKKKRTLPQKRQKTKPDHKKHKRKERTAFPLQKGGEQAKNCVTVLALYLANAFA